jgi:hypothetical protein
MARYPAMAGVSTFQVLTLGVAIIATLGIGAIAAAVITAIATARRERGAWLRQLQVDANRDLYASAQALMTFVTKANPDRAPDHPLGWDAEQQAELTADLHHKVMNLAMVGEPATMEIANTMSEHLPRLAVQALPLPGTRHHPGMAQREDAIRAMSGLLMLASAVMRNDVGLGGWRYRRMVHKTGKKALHRFQSLSPVDRPGPEPDLAQLMWAWHVKNGDGDIPKKLAGYGVAAVPMIAAPDGFAPQAFAIKPNETYWQFGFLVDLDPARRDAIVADALRLITGHHHAFLPKLNPMQLDVEGNKGYVWHGVRPVESHTV